MEIYKFKTEKTVSKINRFALKVRKPYAPIEKVFRSKREYSRRNKKNESS